MKPKRSKVAANRKGFALGNRGRPGPMPEEEKAKHGGHGIGRPRGRKKKLEGATYVQEDRWKPAVDDRGRTERVVPYDRGSIEELREAARAAGTSQLANCVELWSRLVEIGIAFLKGEIRIGKKRGRAVLNHIPDEYAGPILRASENLANRCGLPVLSELSVRGVVPPKLVGETKPNYVNEKGEAHEIEVEGAPEGLH